MIPDTITRAVLDAHARSELDDGTPSHEFAVEFRDRLLADNWPDDVAVAERIDAQKQVDGKHALAAM